MAYEGELLRFCPADINFSNTEAIVVSGASLNPCGHMILRMGNNNRNSVSNGSWYCHVAGQGVNEAMGFYAYPKFMRGEANFHRYLSENGKQEIRRLNAKIINPSAAYDKLIELMASKWFWGVLIHNCASFAKEVIKAGGGNLDVVLNCPDQEFVKGLRNDIIKAAEAVGNAYIPDAQ